MSEPDKAVAGDAPRSPTPPPEPKHHRARRPVVGWRDLLVWAALALAAATAAWTGSRLGALESGTTRRLQAGEQRIAQLGAAVELAQAQLRDAQNRAAVLESKVLEAAGLQVQLEKLYRSLASDSTDVLLAEAESALALASQQLALGSNPQAALGALQEIDSRLSRQDDPSIGGVRRALQRDIDRLKAYPAADIASLVLRLDGLVSSVDQFPLLASVSAAPQAASGAAGIGLDALRGELQQLFRVRRVDTPDAALVAPGQAYFLRQNLLLLLLNARLSLLSRNDVLYRSDLGRAIGWLRSYYDDRDRGVAGAVTQLRQMLGTHIALEPPTLAESLAAVRAARAARDPGR